MMPILPLFAFGLLFGSFMNVCIYRIPIEKSVVFPRSSCMHCGKVLSPVELIPLLSYVILQGRCLGCGQRISPRYFLVELLSGCLFVFVPSYFHFDAALSFIFLYFSCVLVIIFFIDLDHQIIPDVLTFPSLLVGLLAGFKNPLAGGIASSALGAALGFSVFYAVSSIAYLIFKKEALGFGDVKFAAVMGAFFGWKLLFFAMYCSFLAGGIIGGLLILLRLKTRKDYIPFGPFLVIGCFITLFLKDSLMNLYEMYIRLYY